MKIFLDTANLEELRKGAGWGIVDGVTTNPSLIAREGNPFADQIRSICEIIPGDISAAEADAMIRATAALAGAHIATMPFNVLDMLFNHPLTDKGLEQFLKDYRKVYRDAPVGD